MHVITKKRLAEFSRLHPDCRGALTAWHRIVTCTDFNTFVDLRRTFPSADQVGRLTVFNVGGNKVRIIAAIHFNRRRIYIRHVLTHADYDRGDWKE